MIIIRPRTGGGNGPKNGRAPKYGRGAKNGGPGKNPGPPKCGDLVSRFRVSTSSPYAEKRILHYRFKHEIMSQNISYFTQLHKISARILKMISKECTIFFTMKKVIYMISKSRSLFVH